MADFYGKPTVPVVMSIWKRLHLLDRTLFQLSRQKGVQPLVYLLNNNPAIAGAVEDEVRHYRDKSPIHVAQADNRLICFGRFVYARAIKNSFPYLAFIDDDQEFKNTFLRTLWNERTRGGITGCHAFRFRRRRPYVDRQSLLPGRRAEYCGPGGMILDSRLLDQAALFQTSPRALLMDDIWLSYVAGHVLKVPMHKCSALVRMRDFERDTWINIRHKKIEFLEELRDQGWNV